MAQLIDFISLAQAETSDTCRRIRLLALAHFQDGHSRTQIALLLKVDRNGVNKWVANLPAHGLAGLDTMRPPGNPAGLNELKRSQLLLY